MTIVEEETSLLHYAKREMKLAGLDCSDSDYGGLVYDSVLELIEVFANQHHSGGSASAVLVVFCRLAEYKPLSELTDNQAEWLEVEHGFFQNTRDSSAFSRDGGKTFYKLEDKPGQQLWTSAKWVGK